MEAPQGCDPIERDLFVSPRQFASQMAELVSRGFKSVSLDRFMEGRDRTVLITFDDAYAHVAETVTPILNEYGFSAVMFAPTGHLGGRNSWDADRHPRLAGLEVATRDQLASMAEGPWELASHASRHVDLRGVDAAVRLKELTESREQLSEIAGQSIFALAYPYGLVDKAVEEAARLAGYRLAFRAEAGPGHDLFRLPRHPIRGTDNIGIFRLKSSRWLRLMDPVRRIAPAWARSAARAAINAAGTWVR